MTTTPFTMDPALTAISIAYRNPSVSLIADLVLPRTTPVAKKEFGYNVFATGTFFTVPDTRVGRKGTPKEVDIASSRTTAECEDFGLDDPIPQDDITQAAAQGLPSPVDGAVSWLTDLILLDREVRAAALVFALASYPSTNRATLSGDDQWSDVDADPIDKIQTALDTPLMRPNKAVLGQQTWSALRRHPKIVKAANKTSGDTGLISREAFCELFEIPELVIGSSYVNTAKKGQTPTLSRAWGKHAAFLHINPLANTERGVTFGMTVPFGQRIAGAMPDKDIGLRGGQRVRVGESVKEVITAPDAGYFFLNAVA